MNVAAKGVDADLQSAAAQVSSLVSLPSSLSSSLTQQATAGIYLTSSYTDPYLLPCLALPCLTTYVNYLYPLTLLTFISFFSSTVQVEYIVHYILSAHQPHSLPPNLQPLVKKRF